jgi:hypothetical protein
MERHVVASGVPWGKRMHLHRENAARREIYIKENCSMLETGYFKHIYSAGFRCGVALLCFAIYQDWRGQRRFEGVVLASSFATQSLSKINLAMHFA